MGSFAILKNSKLQNFEMQFHHKFIIYMQYIYIYWRPWVCWEVFASIPIHSKYSEGLNLKFILYTFGTQKQHD
jgi:hypothetical protein